MTATLTKPIAEDRTEIAGSLPITAPVVYLSGELVPKTDARVSIYDHGFLYGDGAFEGIRVYQNNIFRLEPHLARLLRSCKAMHIDLGMDVDDLQQAVVSVVRANKLEAGYIRLSVSRGVGLGLDPQSFENRAYRCDFHRAAAPVSAGVVRARPGRDYRQHPRFLLPSA